MDRVSGSAGLLIVIVNEDWGGRLVEVVRGAGAPGCTRLEGRASAGAGPRDILVSLLGGEAEAVVRAIDRVALCEPGLRALALLIATSDLRVSTGPGADGLSGGMAADRSADMETERKLIVAIVNHGYVEEIMSAARRAGAKGGTIVKARGTGTEEDARFFGICLAPEKEMLLILAEGREAPRIVEAVRNQPVLREPGGGIVFTVNVDQAFGYNWVPDGDCGSRP